MTERGDFHSTDKTKYFSKLAMEVRGALRLHANAGRLWERVDGKRDWGNVSEHCLVEVARVGVLADWLGLNSDIKKDLQNAAALHDYAKRIEKEATSSSADSGVAGYEAVNAAVTNNMKSHGFTDRVITLATAMEDMKLPKAEEIAARTNLSQEDMAYIVMHYVDDYTQGSDWAPQTELCEDGSVKNALDFRVDAFEANPRYSGLNEGMREFFNGETAGQAQRRVGHMLEARIASLIGQRTGQEISPLELPRLIDNEIVARINSTE